MSTPTTMNTTENQNDPHAHLKAARKAGKVIQITEQEHQLLWEDLTVEPAWNMPADMYRVKPEPLPADKWAAEKAAHAQGKRIECFNGSEWQYVPNPQWMVSGAAQYRIAPDPAPTYHTPAVVQQRREEAAAINAVMNPAPAGKLTDDQLGKIGAKAVVSHYGVFVIAVEPSEACYVVDTGLRTTFARAVREAVEKEQFDRFAAINAVANDRMNQIFALSEDNKLTRQLVNALRAEKAKQAEEIARLTAELEQANERVEAKQEAYERCAGLLEEERLKNIKANAELERLRWRSVEVKPTAKDAGLNGFLEVMKNGVTSLAHWHSATMADPADYKVTHWRPFCPPPAPTAEEVERERFEMWAGDQSWLTLGRVGDSYGYAPTNDAWHVWQAARAAKEGEK